MARRTWTQNSTDDFPPDGLRVVFHRDRDRDDEIYTLNVDGSNVLQLTVNSTIDRWPQSSPSR